MANEKNTFYGVNLTHDKHTGNSEFKLTAFTRSSGENSINGIMTEMPDIAMSINYDKGPMQIWQEKLNSFLHSGVMSFFQAIGTGKSTLTSFQNNTTAGKWTRKMYNGYNFNDINLKFRTYTDPYFQLLDTNQKTHISSYYDVLNFLKMHGTISEESTFGINHKITEIKNALGTAYNFANDLRNNGDNSFDTLFDIYIGNIPIQNEVDLKNLNTKRKHEWEKFIKKMNDKMKIHIADGYDVNGNYSYKFADEKEYNGSSIKYYSNDLVNVYFEFTSELLDGTENGEQNLVIKLTSYNGTLNEKADIYVSQGKSGNITRYYKTILGKRADSEMGRERKFGKNIIINLDETKKNINKIELTDIENVKNKIEQAVYGDNGLLSFDYLDVTSEYSNDGERGWEINKVSGKEMEQRAFNRIINEVKKAFDDAWREFDAEIRSSNPTTVTIENEINAALDNLRSNTINVENMLMSKFSSRNRALHNYNLDRTLGLPICQLRIYSDIFFTFFNVFITKWSAKPSKYMSSERKPYYYDFDITCTLDQVMSLDTLFGTFKTEEANDLESPVLADLVINGVDDYEFAEEE